MAKQKRKVVHQKLFLSVGGKLEHVPAGTEISLTAEQVESLGDKTVAASAKSVDVDDAQAKKEAAAKKAEAAAKKAEAEAAKKAEAAGDKDPNKTE